MITAIIIIAIIILYIGVFMHRQILGRISDDLDELKEEVGELKEKLGMGEEEADNG